MNVSFIDQIPTYVDGLKNKVFFYKNREYEYLNAIIGCDEKVRDRGTTGGKQKKVK